MISRERLRAEIEVGAGAGLKLVGRVKDSSKVVSVASNLLRLSVQNMIRGANRG